MGFPKVKLLNKLKTNLLFCQLIDEHFKWVSNESEDYRTPQVHWRLRRLCIQKKDLGFPFTSLIYSYYVAQSQLLLPLHTPVQSTAQL